MEGCFNPTDLQALQNLICPPKDDSDAEDDLPQAGARKLGRSTLTKPIDYESKVKFVIATRQPIFREQFQVELASIENSLRLIQCIVRDIISGRE